MKKIKNALSDLSEAHKLDAKNTEALSNRAMAYLEEKNYAKAAEDLTMLIQLHYKLAKTYQARGECYRMLNKKSNADADFRQEQWING